MKKIGGLVFILGCLALGLGLGYALTHMARKPAPILEPVGPGLPPPQRGFVIRVNSATPSPDYSAVFDTMAHARATAIVIRADPTTLSALTPLAAAARQKNLKVWLAVDPPAAPSNAAGVLARMQAAAAAAKTLNVYGVAVGLGTDPALGDDAYWRSLFKNLRTIAPSPKYMFIADNETYPWLTWWDAVDVVGVTGDFQLTRKNNATVDELRGSWRTHLEELDTFAAKLGRPAMLVDIAFKENLVPPQRAAHLSALLLESADRPNIEGLFFADTPAIYDAVAKEWSPRSPATQPHP